MHRSGNPQEWGRQRSLLGRSAVRSMVLGASAGRIPVLHVRPGRMIASEKESEVATDEPCLGAQGAADGGRRAGCMSIDSDRVSIGAPELTVSSDLQVRPASKASVALERAVEYLRDTQAEAGWWKGELETNVTMDAEDLLAARVPRHPYRRRRPSRLPRGSAPSSARTAPGRTSTAAPATCPPRSNPGSRCGLRAIPTDAPHLAKAADVDPGARRRRVAPASSPASGWRSSGCGRGTSCRTFRLS